MAASNKSELWKHVDKECDPAHLADAFEVFGATVKDLHERVTGVKRRQPASKRKWQFQTIAFTEISLNVRVKTATMAAALRDRGPAGVHGDHTDQYRTLVRWYSRLVVAMEESTPGSDDAETNPYRIAFRGMTGVPSTDPAVYYGIVLNKSIRDTASFVWDFKLDQFVIHASAAAAGGDLLWDESTGGADSPGNVASPTGRHHAARKLRHTWSAPIAQPDIRGAVRTLAAARKAEPSAGEVRRARDMGTHLARSAVLSDEVPTYEVHQVYNADTGEVEDVVNV